MKKILKDDTLRNKMGEKAVETAQKFYKTEIIKIWDKVLKREV